MIEGMRVLLKRGVASNKELERTRSTQTAVGPRRSIQCCTDRRTDRKIVVPPPSAAADAHPCYRAQTAPAWQALVRPFVGIGLLSELAQPSSNIMSTVARPSRFHRQSRGPTSVIKRLGRAFTIGTSRLGGARPHNNGLHQTGREGAAVAFRWRPVVEARPAGERGCSTLFVGISRRMAFGRRPTFG
mgnify:CR=1 FL=1